jgi:branched-chain amino acid transport system ATP-binding protein
MALLDARKITKRFGGLQAVGDLDIDVEPGEILGMIGPNGAGKTTVFNLLTGFLRQDSGRVELDGRIIDHLSPEARCSAGLVRTFQVVQPFRDISVMDNVVMGALLRSKSIGEARDAARRILFDVGLERLDGQLARGLPIGDRKRLELAKALATQPRVLLLDEVMGGLNPTEVIRIIELLRKLRDRGLAIVLIEHNMSAVMTLSDRLIVLHHGCEISRGPPSQVSRDPAVLAAYLGEDFQQVGAT